MADTDRKKKKSGVSNNYNYYAGPGGVMTRRAGNAGAGNAGYEKSAERYKERARREKSQEFPNRRRKIITGRDLTTPLRKATVKRTHKRVKFGTNIVAVEKEKLPWLFILKIVALGVAVCVLMLSYIVLYEAEDGINRAINKIRAGHIETSVLERQFELENDSAGILKKAREEYGMVDERYIQKRFISSRNEDKVVIAAKNHGSFPEMVAGFFARGNKKNKQEERELKQDTN